MYLRRFGVSYIYIYIYIIIFFFGRGGWVFRVLGVLKTPSLPARHPKQHSEISEAGDG